MKPVLYDYVEVVIEDFFEEGDSLIEHGIVVELGENSIGVACSDGTLLRCSDCSSIEINVLSSCRLSD